MGFHLSSIVSSERWNQKKTIGILFIMDKVLQEDQPATSFIENAVCKLRISEMSFMSDLWTECEFLYFIKLN